ncbi:hypothetical protein DFH07DRAFT_845284 [Mycena maculata]|uniref:MADS-box domain-containing protein n=1 Tax=Mycena maculata TaxID=230809 RepID=A0AAD7MVE6_9AGAR|nr:hypothetical protein DFH07DRAFT_845284 [Mycena maculata]
MGRRKIEIQPITHERNRSVTFLKRKNGLFKKAYELGVLCSVDIAVIIFEQRPGHNVKLYQYCSGDVQDIVTRQTRFDGEKETRGPPDFSGIAAAKLEDPGEGDDEEQEDEDEVVPLGSKRTRDGSKQGNDLGLNIDVDYRRGQQRPTGSSGIPLSSDRQSPSSKKQRIEPRMLPGRPGSEMSPGGFSYAPSMRSASGGSYNNNNAPYYPGQPFVPPPSFDSFSSSRGRGSLPGSYSEYPLGSSSRPPPHRNQSGDPFGGLLDNEPARQNLPAQGSGYTGIDWPVHNTAGRRRCYFLTMGDRTDA